MSQFPLYPRRRTFVNMIVLSALGPKSDIAHRTPPPNVDSYADDGVASSRHKAINAAKIAGPRKRPINPKALSPPKIPSKTQMNESRAELPIRSGRTKYSAKNTNEPNTSRPNACIVLDGIAADSGGMMGSRAPDTIKTGTPYSLTGWGCAKGGIARSRIAPASSDATELLNTLMNAQVRKPIG